METSGTMIIAGVTTLFGVGLLFLSMFVAGRGGLSKRDAGQSGED
jgi:hypothetical protein